MLGAGVGGVENVVLRSGVQGVKEIVSGRVVSVAGVEIVSSGRGVLPVVICATFVSSLSSSRVLLIWAKVR